MTFWVGVHRLCGSWPKLWAGWIEAWASQLQTLWCALQFLELGDKKKAVALAELLHKKGNIWDLEDSSHQMAYLRLALVYVHTRESSAEKCDVLRSIVMRGVLPDTKNPQVGLVHYRIFKSHLSSFYRYFSEGLGKNFNILTSWSGNKNMKRSVSFRRLPAILCWIFSNFSLRNLEGFLNCTWETLFYLTIPTATRSLPIEHAKLSWSQFLRIIGYMREEGNEKAVSVIWSEKKWFLKLNLERCGYLSWTNRLTTCL